MSLSAKWLPLNKDYLKITSDEKKQNASFFGCHVKTKAKIHRYAVRHKFNRYSNQGRLYLNNGLNEEIISLRLI